MHYYCTFIFMIAVSASAKDGMVQGWEPRSGSKIFSFKQNSSGPKGLALVQGPDCHFRGPAGACDYVLAAQHDRPSIHCWTWPKVRADEEGPTAAAPRGGGGSGGGGGGCERKESCHAAWSPSQHTAQISRHATAIQHSIADCRAYNTGHYPSTISAAPTALPTIDPNATR